MGANMNHGNVKEAWSEYVDKIKKVNIEEEIKPTSTYTYFCRIKQYNFNRKSRKLEYRKCNKYGIYVL